MKYTKEDLYLKKTLSLSHRDRWFSDIYPTWCDYRGGVFKYLRGFEIWLFRFPQVIYPMRDYRYKKGLYYKIILWLTQKSR